MTEKAVYGRWILVAITLLVVAAELGVSGLRWLGGRYEWSDLGRTALTAWLFLEIWNGKAWARWLVVTLFLVGLVYGANLFLKGPEGKLRPEAYGILTGLALFLLFCAIGLASPFVGHYQMAQREPQDTSPQPAEKEVPKNSSGETAISEDAARFQKTVALAGGKPTKPSKKMLDFFQEKNLPDSVVDFLKPYLLRESIEIGGVEIYGEPEILETNAPDFLPIALRDGFLVIGTCLDGDPVVIDLRDRLGEVGYLDHETMWQKSSVREVYQSVASSPGVLVTGLESQALPIDYQEAKTKG